MFDRFYARAFALLTLGVLGAATPGAAQQPGKLAIFMPQQMIAHPEFGYPVVVQLQDEAGNPGHAKTKITVTLSSSNPDIVRIYGSPQLTLNAPHGDFKGDTWAQGTIVATRPDVVGGATITASAPGFGSVSARVTGMIGLPHGNQKWPPATKVSLMVLPPTVVAGEKGPHLFVEPRDANGRPTADPSDTGASVARFRVESSNPAVFPHSARGQLSDRYYGGMSNFDSPIAAAPGRSTLTVRLFDRPNLIGGTAALVVVPAAATVQPNPTPDSKGTVVTRPPPPKPPEPPKALTDVPLEIVLQPGQAWEGDLPVSSILDLQARIQYDRLAGANFVLDFRVNGQQVTGPLLNKAAQFSYKDGRTYPYYDAARGGWLVFYSPDFAGNNSDSSSGYRVLTDPGQAYHYRWNIASIAGKGPTMRVRIANTNTANAAALVIRITK